MDFNGPLSSLFYTLKYKEWCKSDGFERICKTMPNNPDHTELIKHQTMDD